jgi:hypothetical protein
MMTTMAPMIYRIEYMAQFLLALPLRQEPCQPGC